MRTAFTLALLFCVPLAGAQEQPRIRVNVRLINVAFTVRDAAGTLVTGLTKDDFEVLEDGIPQTIAFFARPAELPLTLGLLDDTSGSQDSFAKSHQRDLEAFLDSVLTAHDRAFLLCFGNHLRLASDFVSSAAPVLDGLRRFEHRRERFPEIGPSEYRELGTAFYDAIYYSTTEKLASVKNGRKALIVFSDGEDNSSAHHMLEAIEAAQLNDVVVYGVRYTESRHGVLTARNKYGISVMERISRDTGGADFDARREDLSKSFGRIGEELRSSYELAYHAASQPASGGYHKLVVRAKRPGLVVRAKTGYVDKGD